MYLKMVRASEQAVRILIRAQQECEEMYVSGPEAELAMFPGKENAPELVDQSGAGGGP